METQENAVETTTEAVEAAPAEAPATEKKMAQKEAVLKFVKEAVGENPEGKNLKELVTKDIRKIVRQRLFDGLKSGEIRLSKSFDDSRLKKYASGLINNWLKKDTRFN